MNSKSLVVLLVVAMGVCSGVAWARTDEMKKRCDNCHTMHNTQGGNNNVSGMGLQSALLVNSCYGCHTGVNVIDPGHLHTPYVMSIGAPNYGITGTEVGNHNTLAGGSFYWVAQGSTHKGHDVNIPGVIAPVLTCAGVNGCHGDLTMSNETAAMARTHHAPESVQPRDGSTLALSYRFLNGIAGSEDTDYELTVSSTDHNQYKGVARMNDSNTANSSISHLCANCHSTFHSVTGTGYGTTDPWLRHPVDYDMGGLGGEFASYGSVGGTFPNGTYNVATPLGSSDVSAVKDKVFTAAGDAIVVCVSCHRAHGSPFDYNLRWNYKNWPNGVNAYNGCGDCHTTKD